MLKIDKTIENRIIEKLCAYDVETGGIIGGYNDEITCFVFDDEPIESSVLTYIPNVESLSITINVDWYESDIEFKGIVHSHINNSFLSEEDVKYGREIMISCCFDKILMGLVCIKNRTITWYEISVNETRKLCCKSL